MDVTSLAIIVLLTGIVVVFAVLLILSIVIKGYSEVIHVTRKKPLPKAEVRPVRISHSIKKTNSIDNKIIAIISAAVYEFYNQNNKKYKILDIEQVINQNSKWRSSGVLQNTLPFRN